MPRHLFYAGLLAAVVSTPLAAAIVLVHWLSMEPAIAVSMSPALWSGRSFVATFDVLVILTWLPCATWISRLSARRRVPAALDQSR